MAESVRCSTSLTPFAPLLACYSRHSDIPVIAYTLIILNQPTKPASGLQEFLNPEHL